MLDPYLYSGTNVMRNKLGIRDKNELERAEGDYTSFRMRFLLENPPEGKFDFKHFCKYHQTIFQDIYDWAGKPRTINIEKAEHALGGISIEYGDVKNIDLECNQALAQMREYPWKKMSVEERANAFADSLAKVWKIHPFREGNTRVSVTFVSKYYESQGFPIEKKLFEQNSTYVRTALVAYNAVFTDLGDKSQPHYLRRIVKDAIEIGESHCKKKTITKEQPPQRGRGRGLEL